MVDNSPGFIAKNVVRFFKLPDIEKVGRILELLIKSGKTNTIPVFEKITNGSSCSRFSATCGHDQKVVLNSKEFAEIHFNYENAVTKCCEIFSNHPGDFDGI